MDNNTRLYERRSCQPGTASDRIVLHADLEALVLPHSGEEQAASRRRLERDGELGPLVVWQGHDILVEGYPEIHIYREKGIAFTVIEKEFRDLEEIQFYILTRQLSRTLSGLALSYLRGKRYLVLEKRRGQRTDLTSCQDGGKSTAQRLGQELTTGARTIYRDARVAKAIDAIAASCDALEPKTTPKARDLILARHSGVTQKRVLRLAPKPVDEKLELIHKLRQNGQVERSCKDKHESKKVAMEMNPQSILRVLPKHLKPQELAELSEGLVALVSVLSI